MAKLINLIGQKFGRLVVVKKANNGQWRHQRWLCKCVCGKEKIVRVDSLKNGKTKSCGCLFLEGNRTQHGHSTRIKTSGTYKIWQSMIQRCTNPKNISYHNYGGRGITVCKRWLKFENFLEDMGEIPEGYQIDRIDNDKGYCKSNCSWVTPKQNSRNTRRSRLVTHKGKTQCLIEWAEEYNINYGTLWHRIYKYGWSAEKALTTPVIKRRQKK